MYTAYRSLVKLNMHGKIKHACAYLGLQKHDWYLLKYINIIYKKYKLLKLPIWWGTLLYMTYMSCGTVVT